MPSPPRGETPLSEAKTEDVPLSTINTDTGMGTKSGTGRPTTAQDQERDMNNLREGTNKGKELTLEEF